MRSAGRPDFVELNEDLSSSPLWNPDLAPTPASRRTWSTYHIAALWIGMSVVITTYTLASGLMQQGMTWSQAMFTILLGNAIVLIPMILNAHAGTKYGVSFPVLCRASFGVKGANVPALLRAFVACGWFGIQTWIGGVALHTLLGAAVPAWLALPGNVWIAFALFWGVQVWIIVHGLDGIKRLESWSAPLLLGGGLLLLLWAVRRGGGLGHVLAESTRLQTTDRSFWELFPAGLTANVGYWATLSLNIPDFTRYARSQRSQALGQALGLPATMTAFAFIGVAVTSATVVIYGEAIWDPVQLIARIGNPAVIVFGTLVILVAQLTTNMAANVVSPANDFSSLAPRRITYVMGGLITALIGIAMLPWKLYADASAYIFTWLVGYSSLMGGIGGILIADYWIVRRRELSLPDLFKVQGRYTYTNGINWRAMACLAAAILPVVPGFLRAATTPGGQVPNPGFLDTLYTYAWFVTFALSVSFYLLVTRRSPQRARAAGERAPATTTTATDAARAAASLASRERQDDNPRMTDQQPAVSIRQVSAPELKALLDTGARLELVDVRTDAERALAFIEGSRLLDQAYHDALLRMDRETPLVFQCHHGIRSQHAAEYFRQAGFRNLSNLRGGIDAWSQLVDPAVPRY
jgi:NCS1 family nucleobase:cation symporter-1